MSYPLQDVLQRTLQDTVASERGPDSDLRQKIAALPRPLKAKLILAALKKGRSGGTAGLASILKPHLGEARISEPVSERLINGILAEFTATLVNTSSSAAEVDIGNKKAGNHSFGHGSGQPAKPDAKIPLRKAPLVFAPVFGDSTLPLEIAKTLKSEHFCVAAILLSKASTGYVAQVLKFMRPTYAQKTALSLSDIESGRQNISGNVANTIHTSFG